jgi:hypothetical protein
MHYKLNDYNNEESLGERIEMCQKFLGLGGMWLILYTWMRLVSIYIWHLNLKGFVEDKDATEFVQLKSSKFIFGGCN